MSSVTGLDKRLQEVLTRPEFLEMRGVAKEVPIITIYRGVFPFMITCTAALVVMILFPEMVTWLPDLLMGA